MAQEQGINFANLNALLRATIDILESGDDEGCDGLVVVGENEYHALRNAVHTVTNIWYGVVESDKEE